MSTPSPLPWNPEIVEDGPVYLALLRALESDIARGRLQAGDRLPTHRDLAATLGVNVGTITRAYGEARRRGLIEGEVGRGTYVRERPPSALARVEPERESGLVDLSMSIPTALPHPDLAGALQDLVDADRASPGHLDALTSYRDPAGDPGLREAGARWLARFGHPSRAEDLVVCAGAQHAILVALGAIAGPGDLVLGEELTYPGFMGAARLLGLRVRGVPLDEGGLDPDALEERCRAHRPRLLYCMPGLQNPTCAQLSESRRRTIAEIAERHDLFLVQDEIHAGLVEDGGPSLAALAPNRVFTIGSLSKTVSAGIRIAFLAGPTGQAARLAELIWSSSWMASPLGSPIAERWLEDGTATQVLADRRVAITARHEIAREALGDLPYQTRRYAFHVWLPLPAGWSPAQATDALLREGVRVSASDEFRIEGSDPAPALRLSLSTTEDPARLAAGLRTVRRVLSRSAAPRTLA